MLKRTNQALGSALVENLPLRVDQLEKHIHILGRNDEDSMQWAEIIEGKLKAMDKKLGEAIKLLHEKILALQTNAKEKGTTSNAEEKGTSNAEEKGTSNAEEKGTSNAEEMGTFKTEEGVVATAD
jgi:hypothetical protein